MWLICKFNYVNRRLITVSNAILEVLINSCLDPCQPLKNRSLEPQVLLDQIIDPLGLNYLLLIPSAVNALVDMLLLPFVTIRTESMLARQHHHGGGMIILSEGMRAHWTSQVLFNAVKQLIELGRERLGPILGLFGAFELVLNRV